MKFVIQRVTSSEVKIREKEASSEIVRNIGRGFLVLIGISQEDIEEFFDSGKRETADKMIKKLVNMRIFEDEEGKTNLSIDSVNGEMLLISQFTLYADCKHGNRPSFTDAGKPDKADELYKYIVSQVRTMLDEDPGKPSRVKTGEFGAHMEVGLVNDGPFTIVLDSRDL